MCLCHGHQDSQRGIRGKNPHAYRPPFLTPFPFLFRSFAFPTHPEAKPCDSGPEPKTGGKVSRLVSRTRQKSFLLKDILCVYLFEKQHTEREREKQAD